MFVCLGFIVPLENVLLIRRRHYYRWRAANFDLCSALVAIEQWGFFTALPYLLWHGAWSCPRTRDTHTYWRAFSSGAVTTCFNNLGLSRLGLKHPTFCLRGQRSNHHRHHSGNIDLKLFLYFFYDIILMCMHFTLNQCHI